MNIFDKKGFNFIEVIIAIVIAGLIIASFSQLFSLSLDLPIISDRSKALYYAQKEMEKLNNMSYDNILPISKRVYPDDTNYDYEIKVSENTQRNKKEVKVLFTYRNQSGVLVELFSEFIKLEKFKICDDFQDNNWNAPQWNWTRSPSGQWSLVIFPSNSGNYRAYYTRRQLGYIYPDWAGSSDYSVSVDFYVINNYPQSNMFSIDLYGRYNNLTNNGYMVDLTTSIGVLPYDTYTLITLYRVVNGVNYTIVDTNIPNLNLFDSWHNLKLEFLGEKIRVYLDSNIILEATNSQFTQGSIRISVASARNSPIYLDNICIEY